MLVDSDEAGRRPTFTDDAPAAGADGAAAASGADTAGAALAAAAGADGAATPAAGAAAPPLAGAEAEGAATACAGAAAEEAAEAAGVAGVTAAGVAAVASVEAVAAGPAAAPSADVRPATVITTVARPGVPETALPAEVVWVATRVWVPAAVPAGIVAVPFSTDDGPNVAMTGPLRASRWMSMFDDDAELL